MIAVAIGTFVRNNLAEYANFFGFPVIANHLHIFSIGLMKYLVHGVPEIIAYFIGGLAGGIRSIAIIKKDFSNFRC